MLHSLSGARNQDTQRTAFRCRSTALWLGANSLPVERLAKAMLQLGVYHGPSKSSQPPMERRAEIGSRERRLTPTPEIGRCTTLSWTLVKNGGSYGANHKGTAFARLICSPKRSARAENTPPEAWDGLDGWQGPPPLSEYKSPCPKTWALRKTWIIPGRTSC